ncbi:hypothetical protein D3C87_1888810 [compost metagenome]
MKTLYSALVVSASSIKKGATVTVFKGAVSPLLVNDSSAIPAIKEPPGIATIP